MADRPSPEDFLSMTVKTACAVTGFSKDALYDLINADEVATFLMGSRRYIDAASLRDYIERRAKEPLHSARLPPRRDGPRREPARTRTRTTPRGPPA